VCGKVEEYVIKNAEEFILSLPKLSYPLGNESLKKLLCLLQNPEKNLKFIHIAGTNGKGSCAVMTGSILKEAGYKTGVFTSPFLVDFCERIRIGDKNIPKDKLKKYTCLVYEKMLENGISLSQFAFILAVAFCYYSDEKCDAVVLEVGLGGRLDATNVIDKSLVSVIMSIGLDHTELLGDTKEKIAYEKAGIIKTNGDCVLLKGEKSVEDVIKNECKIKNARLHITKKTEKTENGVIWENKEYVLGLKGDYQADNVSAVLEVVSVLRQKSFKIPEDAVKNGLKNAVHQGRFHRVRENVLLDSAHNPDGIKALLSSLKREEKDTLVIAMIQDKDIDQVLNLLKDEFKRIIVTSLPMPRCESAENLAKRFENLGKSCEIVPDTAEAFKLAEKSDFSVILGSVYLAGESLKYFLKK